MIWPFRRRRKPVHFGPTSVDWKPGDMAECVGHFELYSEAPPLVGDRLMVSDVAYKASSEGPRKGASMFMLYFIGRRNGYQSTHFRKIVLTDTGADRKVAKKRPLKVYA